MSGYGWMTWQRSYDVAGRRPALPTRARMLRTAAFHICRHPGRHARAQPPDQPGSRRRPLSGLAREGLLEVSFKRLTSKGAELLEVSLKKLTSERNKRSKLQKAYL